MRRLLLCACALTLAGCGERAEPRAPDTPAASARATSAPASAPASATVPVVAPVAVQVGSPDEEIDACSVGAIRAGRADGARRVAVRSGPGARYPAVDSLPSGTAFHSCDAAEGWVGIVYRRETDPPDSTGSCGGLSSPIAVRRAYDGPCRSGWIASDAQEITAG